MYKHILIPTDGSEEASIAVRAGIAFAREAGAKVTLFTAVPEYELPRMEGQSRTISLEEHERRSGARAQKVFADALAHARAAGVDCDTDYVLNDRPHVAIVEACNRQGCDAIFIGSRARTGLAGLWHGSETLEVVTHSDVPTVVYHV